MTKHKHADVVAMVEKYLRTFVTFPDTGASFVAALWCVMTHVWIDVTDTVPYLAIQGFTKRSGKTTLGECISFAGSNSLMAGGITNSALFHRIQDTHPVVYMDEAEKLSSAAHEDLRKALNVGYRRGQTWENAEGSFDLYSPKCFMLIGTVHDTLKDRTIALTMQRADAPIRSTYTQRKDAGNIVREQIHQSIVDASQDILNAVEKQVQDGLPFFESARDEEIWTVLFALATVFCPNRIPELRRSAVDLATEKGQDMAEYIRTKYNEKELERAEYAERLLLDLMDVMKGEKAIRTVDAIERLKGIDVAPWRRYKGEGITADNMGYLLDVFGVAPKPIRFGTQKKGQNQPVARGYSRDDIRAAIAKANLKR